MLSWKWQPTLVFLLGNPMDRGAWWARVHGVAESEHSWARALRYTLLVDRAICGSGLMSASWCSWLSAFGWLYLSLTPILCPQSAVQCPCSTAYSSFILRKRPPFVGSTCPDTFLPLHLHLMPYLDILHFLFVSV